jgi:O-antigen/teichoic acid export membrane protein
MVKKLLNTFFTRFLIAVILFCNLIVSTRYLGSSVYGMVNILLLNMAIVHAVAEILTGSSLVYFLPKLPINRIYRMGLLWIFCVSIVLGLALGLINHLINPNMNDIYLHLIVLSIISALLAFHNIVILGREKIGFYNFLLLLQPVLLMIGLCVGVFVLNNRTFAVPLISLYFSYSATLAISFFPLLKEVSTNRVEENNIGNRQIFGNGFYNQLGNLAHILSNRFNYFVLEGISISMVGVYSGATSVIESVWIVSASVSPVVLTHIANQRDVQNNSRLSFLLAKICFLLSLLCVFVVYLIPNEFFISLLGKDFAQAKSVMIYLSPGVLAISFSSILSHYFSGLGQQKVLLTANVCGFAVTLIASFFLVSHYGLFGACITAAMAYCVQALVLVIVFMRRNGYRAGSILVVRKDIELLK